MSAAAAPSSDARPALRPEEELILACAAAQHAPGAGAEDRIGALLAGPLDWPWIFSRARKNGASADLSAALGARGGGGAPEAMLAELKNQVRAAGLNLIALRSELAQILALFAREGIECMPMKGPALGERYYPRPAHRETGDLDLCVRRGDAPRARALLAARGYRLTHPLDDEDWEAFAEADCELTLLNPAAGTLVEVHWEFLPPIHRLGYDAAFVWARAEKTEFAGQPALGLPPEDLLLYLCIHGGEKHDWSNLKWVCDVAAVLGRAPALDWDRLFDLASQVGRMRTLSLGVLLARRLLGAPVPAGALARLDSGARLRGQAAIAVARMFREESGLPGFSQWRRYAGVIARDPAAASAAPAAAGSAAAPGFFGYLRAILAPDWSDRQALALPRPLWMLYYPFRVFRIAGQVRGQALRRLK